MVGSFEIEYIQKDLCVCHKLKSKKIVSVKCWPGLDIEREVKWKELISIKHWLTKILRPQNDGYHIVHELLSVSHQLSPNGDPPHSRLSAAGPLAL